MKPAGRLTGKKLDERRKQGVSHTYLCGASALTTSEEALRQLCEPKGIVEWVQLITDRETDRSRGFGCVDPLGFLTL